jgi:hypothetical protein
MLQGKSIKMTQSECVFVAIGNQHAMSVCHIMMCGLFAYTMFLLINKKGTIFVKQKLNIKCVLRFSVRLFSGTFLILKITE